MPPPHPSHRRISCFPSRRPFFYLGPPTPTTVELVPAVKNLLPSFLEPRSETQIAEAPRCAATASFSSPRPQRCQPRLLLLGIERISAKASPTSAPAPLPTSQKYSAGLPAITYGVRKRANDIVDNLLSQIDAASRDRDRKREQMEHRNYQIAIEVSELEASLSSRAAECESLSKTLAQRDNKIGDLRDQIASLEGKLDAQRPLLAEQIGCASKLYDELREVVKLVDSDAASTLSDSVFVWKETDVEAV